MGDDESFGSEYDSISDISSLGSFADRHAAKVTEEVAATKSPRKSKRKTTVKGEAGAGGETTKKRKSTVRKKKNSEDIGTEIELVAAEASERRITARKTKKLKLKDLNDRILGMDEDFGDLEIPTTAALSTAPAVASPVIVPPVQQTPMQASVPMNVVPASSSSSSSVPATRAPSPKINVLGSSRISPLPTEPPPTPSPQYSSSPTREAGGVAFAAARAPSPTVPLKIESAASSRHSSINNHDISGKNPIVVSSAVSERRRIAAAARAAKAANQSTKEQTAVAASVDAGAEPGKDAVEEFSAPDKPRKASRKVNRDLPVCAEASIKKDTSNGKSRRQRRSRNSDSDSSDVASLDSYMSSDDSEQRARRRKKEKQRQKERESRKGDKKAKEIEREREREREREKEREQERVRAEEASRRAEKVSRKREKKSQKERSAAPETDDAMSSTADDTPPVANTTTNNSSNNNDTRLATTTPVPLTQSFSFGWKTEKDQKFCKIIRSTTYLNAIKIAHSEIPKVLCASADSTVQIYNITDGSPLPALVGHTDRVISLAVSNPFMLADKASAGKATLKTLVASGSRDEQLRIWDMDTAKCLHCIHAHKSPIWAVAIAVRPNGDVIVVSTSGDGSMRSWDGKTGKKMVNFKGHTDKVLSVYIMNPLSDNPLMLTAGADKKIRVWELLSGAHIRMLEGHEDEINSVVAGSFSGISSLVPISGANEDKNHAAVAGLDANKSTVIVSASKDLTVRVWDFKSGHLLFELLGHTACVYEVALMRARDSPLATGKKVIPPGTPIIVSCSEDATVKLWNLVTGKLIKSLKWHNVSVRGIDVASVLPQTGGDPNSGISLIASCGWDKAIQFHELGEALYAQKEGFCSIS